MGNLFLVLFFLVAKPWQLGNVGGGYGTINDLLIALQVVLLIPIVIWLSRRRPKMAAASVNPHRAEHPHGMPGWQTQGGVAPAARVTDMAQSSRPPDEGERPRPLLAGKLAVPLLQPGVVTRDRLLEVLDENGTRRLCVVVAPAGWGKTTLLAEWTRRAGDRHSVAWVTLDETDDEPHRFWANPKIGEREVLAALLEHNHHLLRAAQVRLASVVSGDHCNPDGAGSWRGMVRGMK